MYKSSGRTLKNSNRKVIVMIFIVLLILIIGAFSYAWLRTVVYGEKDVEITVGSFDLVLNEPSGGINLVNALPVYDEEGKTNTPYQFSLENKSNIPNKK